VKELDPWRGIDVRVNVRRWPRVSAGFDDELLNAGGEGRNLAAYMCHRNNMPIQPFAQRMRTRGITHRTLGKKQIEAFQGR
jgi:hypothetical protein